MLSSNCVLLIAARLGPIYPSPKSISSSTCLGWLQHVFVHKFGKVIFLRLLCWSRSWFCWLNRNNEKARCGNSICLCRLSFFFRCPFSFETGPMTLSFSSTCVSESSSYATWLLSKAEASNWLENPMKWGLRSVLQLYLEKVFRMRKGCMSDRYIPFVIMVFNIYNLI